MNCHLHLDSVVLHILRVNCLIRNQLILATSTEILTNTRSQAQRAILVNTDKVLIHKGEDGYNFTQRHTLLDVLGAVPEKVRKGSSLSAPPPTC